MLYLVNIDDIWRENRDRKVNKYIQHFKNTQL